MRSRCLPLLLVGLALWLPVGCGGKSPEATRADAFKQGYRNVFDILSQAQYRRSRIDPNEFTQEIARRALLEQAAAEDRAAAELIALTPPRGARRAVQRMVRELRRLAKRDRRLASGPPLAWDVFDTTACCASRRFEAAWAEIKRHGFHVRIALHTGIARGDIDDAAGGYAGVRLAGTVADARRILGRSRRRDQVPAIIDDYTLMPNEPCLGLPCGGTALGYGDVFLRSKKGRITQILVYGDGAKTSQGVGIGDSLDGVRSAYRGARCEEAVNAHTYHLVARCGVITPGAYIYFADNPIILIALTQKPVLGLAR